MRNNNTPENLLVFASNADHSAFHKSGKYYIDSEGVAHCDERKIKICSRCGKEISKKAILCEKCAKLESRIAERPSREELKKLIKEKSFVEIGKMYNVSDNAIRKWCLAMNLPNKKTYINLIEDSEWEKI